LKVTKPKRCFAFSPWLLNDSFGAFLSPPKKKQMQRKRKKKKEEEEEEEEEEYKDKE